MIDPHKLTEKEQNVMEILSAAWNRYNENLPIQHASDVKDFEKAIHDAQRVIMSRPVFRYLHDLPVAEDPNKDIYGKPSIPSNQRL